MKRKKMIACILSLCMLATMMPVTVMAEETTVDTGWYSTEGNSFTLEDAADLAGLAKLVNEGNDFSGKTVTLGADIDLENEEWTPIGYMGKTFKGTFDGGNYTISNLKITKELSNTSANNGIGLFGRTDSPAVIKDLTIENVDITGSLYVGAVVGYGYTGKEVSNCTVKGDIAIDAWWYAGVIGGNGYMGEVKDCRVIGDSGSYIKGNDGSYIGGIWGFRGEGSNDITNCSVTNLSITGVDRVGGICGIAHYGNTISECSVDEVKIEATDEEATTVGLIAGANQGGKNEGATRIPSYVINNEVSSDTTAKIGDDDVTDTLGSTGTTINNHEPAPTTVIGTGVVLNNNGELEEGTFETDVPADKVSEGATITVGDKVVSNNNGSLVTMVAKVGTEYYSDLQEAIKAAAPAGTVEILSDVTVDKWIMFAEEMTIGNGNLITLNINGLTINGNGHTLTVNSIESAGNGNRLFYDAENLNINDLTINIAEGVAGGIGLQSGTINNVTFEGGTYGVLPGVGDVTIKDSTFKTNGTAIYHEEERDNLTVTGNTFELGENTNVILLRGDTEFTNNTIVSGRTVNVVSGSPVVTGNDFNDVRFKVYNGAEATIKNNTINNLVFDSEDYAENPVKSTFANNALSDAAQEALDAAGVENVKPVDPTPSTSSKKSTKKYAVSIDDDEIENGSIKLSSSKAKKGATVTLTVTPDVGYKLDKLVVLDDDGDKVELTDKGNGKFTFKMPRGGVEVEASFVEIEGVEVDDEKVIVLTIGEKLILIDGEYVVNDVAPIIRGERTVLPIRVIAEALGASVSWNEAEQTVTIVKGEMTIVVYIGQAFALVNGEPVELDQPAFIESGRTYLPLRFIMENLGAEVTWDGAAQTVTIIG